jgi:mono/diheme cytochrome c family protein
MKEKAMYRKPAVPLGVAAMILSTSLFAGPNEELLAQYATAARADAPTFSGFSAARGKTLHAQKFSGGKPDTPSCTACHGENPRGAGRTLTGKDIEAVAVSVTPKRYTDVAKVEKWFKRNCNEVLGRECNAQEKGDWLSFMLAQ